MTRWFWLGVLAAAVAGGASAVAYFGYLDLLPEQVPVHWDLHGQPDRFVPRGEAWVNFWLLPPVLLGFLGLTLALPWLSPRQFEIDRFRDTYGYAMALATCLLAYLHLVVVWLTFHPDASFVKWFVTGVMVFFALFGNVMGRLRRNFYVGIRTPWTLASEAVWNRTHRVAAWVFAVFGIVGAVAVLAGLPPLWCFVALMVVVVFTVGYSLAVYKRLEREGQL